MDEVTLTERLPKSVLHVDVVSVNPISEHIRRILTAEHVKAVAEKAWICDVEILDYKIEPYSNEKLGFLGLHCCLKITVRKKKTQEIESQSFFLKCVPSNNDSLAHYISEIGVFEREVDFYNHIFPLLQQEYQEQFWAPMCYLVVKDVIVFEDLRTKGFTMHGKLFNKEETMAAVSAIALMHAASILAEKRLGKALNEIYPQAFDLFSYYDPNGPRMKWFLSGIKLTIFLAKNFGLETNKIRPTCEKLMEFIKPSRDQCNVVTHSDLWSNNLMFDESSPLKCVIVDFQMLRYCSFAQDFIVFLYLCTNREFRNQYQQEMMRHYYKTLCDIIRQQHTQIQLPEWLMFVRGVEENTLYAVIIAALYFPSSFIDGKMCAELLTDPASFINFMYVDRTNVVQSLMQQDKKYNQRVKESVIELVEISQRLS